MALLKQGIGTSLATFLKATIVGVVSLAGSPPPNHPRPSDAAGGKSGTTDFGSPARGYRGRRWWSDCPRRAGADIHLVPRGPRCAHEKGQAHHALVREFPSGRSPAIPTGEDQWPRVLHMSKALRA